jgi:exopolysaccharide biosynthesis protein
MLYNMSGNILYDPFADNMELDYAYDAATNANYSVIRVFQTKRDGTKQYPFVRYPGRMKASALAAQEGWSLIINAGLGVSSSQPIDGVAIENGIVKNENPATYHVGSMPLTIDANGNLAAVAANSTASSLVSSGIISATCGFCAIVENYAAVDPLPDVNIDGGGNHFNDNAPRQIIGQFGNGDYAIVSCAGRSQFNSDGWKMSEAQDICIKLGLKFAYNLDGGKSVATFLRKKPVWDFMAGESRVVPSFIVFNGTTNYSVPAVG